MKKRKLTIVASVVLILFAMAIAGLASAASSQVYYLVDHSGATLYWKGDEAYLFLGSGHTGYRFSYWKYSLIVIGEYFYSVPSPSDQRAIGTVMRVTPSGVERHVEYGENAAKSADLLTPFDDGFYGMCSGGALCKWTGKGFEPATEEEQGRHDGTNHLRRFDINNQTINGWSVREVRSSPGDHFKVSVGDKFVIAAKNLASEWRVHPPISIDLMRPGQPPERLYDANGTPRTVSRTEYERIFPKR
jgi:hypothetical protein